MKALSVLLTSGWLLFGCSSFKAADVATIVDHGATAARTADIVIIANLGVAATTLTPEELSGIYLLRKRTWQDGTKIIPVNREAGSRTRTIFTVRILRQQQSILNSYWDKMYFKGVMPPLVQESDQAVLAFVQNVPGAVGYLSASTALKNVKVLAEIK